MGVGGYRCECYYDVRNTMGKVIRLTESSTRTFRLGKKPMKLCVFDIEDREYGLGTKLSV